MAQNAEAGLHTALKEVTGGDGAGLGIFLYCSSTLLLVYSCADVLPIVYKVHDRRGGCRQASATVGGWVEAVEAAAGGGSSATAAFKAT